MDSSSHVSDMSMAPQFGGEVGDSQAVFGGSANPVEIGRAGGSPLGTIAKYVTPPPPFLVVVMLLFIGLCCSLLRVSWCLVSGSLSVCGCLLALG